MFARKADSNSREYGDTSATFHLRIFPDPTDIMPTTTDIFNGFSHNTWKFCLGNRRAAKCCSAMAYHALINVRQKASKSSFVKFAVVTRDFTCVEIGCYTEHPSVSQ